MSILSNVALLPNETRYQTQEGISITRILEPIPIEGSTDRILNEIDKRRGALFSSSYEYPGRYSRWDIGFVNPALEMRVSGRNFTITALNKRGEILLDPIADKLNTTLEINLSKRNSTVLTGFVQIADDLFYEEERSKQSSVFSLIRAIKELFASSEDSFLGLYGAFGYDLVFQLEPMELKIPRTSEQADLVLYLPDELTIVDHKLSCAYQLNYEFEINGKTTRGLAREGHTTARSVPQEPAMHEYRPGQYADLVKEAIQSFRKGDLFEVVPTHVLVERCPDSPSAVFLRLREINPSPYGFIVNLGSEFLVGSSPEMYVRVEEDRVETCPISGTIRRGVDAIEDADRIRELLNSAKDEAELTMCTDVDRNDKSRICIPGSVQVIGRRQTEMYSHLIHTVDHVEGRLSPQFDSIDAFITHMWAVTITGAPKRAAIRWIENHETAPRGWYGGAVGYLAFNGNINTGLTLRTIKIKGGIAEIRVGATLLYDSVPQDEEAETLTKAAALVQAIRGSSKKQTGHADPNRLSGLGKRILLVDHEDSFVHTLANYFRQTGAEVVTLRSHYARTQIPTGQFDLVVLSPGPGRPEDFHLSETIQLCIDAQLPIFGVCLGLQGLVEYFGGTLNYLDEPRHGKSNLVTKCSPSPLWADLPDHFDVGLYHSIFAEQIPDCLTVTARTDDGIVMAIEHQTLPISAVQFHPESIMTARSKIGFKLVDNVIGQVK